MLLLAGLAAACQPDLVVGTWSCPVGPREPDDAGVLQAVTGPVQVPWSTDFEHGFCDLYVAKGYCYDHEASSYELTNTVAHSGKQSLAFTIDTSVSEGRHTRCVREGTLPEDAVYGAWYYFPESRDNPDNWNLFHFQGGDDLHGIWDVSVESDSKGLKLFLLTKFLTPGKIAQQDPATYVPIGSWFHLTFRLHRAADATGFVRLYQDGNLVLESKGLITDDTTFEQWYVGNLANRLTPAQSTLYVDDISIERPGP